MPKPTNLASVTLRKVETIEVDVTKIRPETWDRIILRGLEAIANGDNQADKEHQAHLLSLAER
jgi:hypothetical protein